DAQGLTVTAVLEQDRDAIYHAVMQDPIVQARLTLDDTWRMTDELIKAEAEWLPAWLGGRSPALAGDSGSETHRGSTDGHVQDIAATALAWRHHGCDRAHRSRLRRKRDRIARRVRSGRGIRSIVRTLRIALRPRRDR